MSGIEHLLHKRLVICVGCGGVGKTTTAAALALAGAAHRRSTAVITVDPARRLKDALGLDDLSIDPRRVGVDSIGHFDALALDTKRTFDALVQRFAASPQAASRILDNRLYQELSNELAGSAEYMAMEKLHELVTSKRYQLLVVDTPPSAHLRDLLTAPNRLVGLLASRAVRLLQAPTSLLSGVESATGRLALSGLLKALQRWTGFNLLDDLAEFVSGFEHMLEGFSRRAEEVTRMLHAPTTAFVLVTTPEVRTIETTVAFHRELSSGAYPVAGVIANRVVAFPRLKEDDPGLRHWEAALTAKLRRNYNDLRELSQRDRRALQHLHAETRVPLIGAVPAVSIAPTSLDGLRRFATFLAPDLEAMSAPPAA
ncbi:MAG TPA: ArsA-related P-loop ATPase [Candidatus Acidoferrales bacterium]|nr:ArsA-related P-loop ATPase [Candidatus Acidoferrales bacterium]